MKAESVAEPKTESRSRRLFGTDGIRGTANQFPMTPDIVMKVGQWMGHILRRAPGLHELPLIEALQREQRAFIKPLRFDAKGTTAFPSALLLDCGQAPMALHVLSKFSNGKERSSKEKDLTTKVGWPWIWRTETRMPPLPKAAVPRA